MRTSSSFLDIEMTPGSGTCASLSTVALARERDAIQSLATGSTRAARGPFPNPRHLDRRKQNIAQWSTAVKSYANRSSATRLRRRRSVLRMRSCHAAAQATSAERQHRRAAPRGKATCPHHAAHATSRASMAPPFQVACVATVVKRKCKCYWG